MLYKKGAADPNAPPARAGHEGAESSAFQRSLAPGWGGDGALERAAHFRGGIHRGYAARPAPPLTGYSDRMAQRRRHPRSARRAGALLVLCAFCGAPILAWARFGWFRDAGTVSTLQLPYVLQTRYVPPFAHVRLSEATEHPGARLGYTAGDTVREAWFVTTEVTPGPEGSVLIRRPAWLGTTLITPTGESFRCGADGTLVRFRDDGRDALLESGAGWLDAADGCAFLAGDAGWIGAERVVVDQDGVHYRGRVVSPGVWLEQAYGGVAIRSENRWIATLGAGGVVPIDPALAERFSSDPVLKRRGGACVRMPGLGNPEFFFRQFVDAVEGPDSRFTRCLRFRDGAVFDHPGLAIDTDLSVLHGRFIDLDSGQDTTFPRWSDIPYVVPESWSEGCDVFVLPNGDVRTGLCW